MSKASAIQWTDATWNPWHGCAKVSPGCAHCYMYQEKMRYGQDPHHVVESKTTFTAPLRWQEPRLIFTCSWSDFFIENADAWREAAWTVIRETPRHTYQILTKRPERIRDHLPADWGNGWSHVWIGVSVESQDYVEQRIVPLLDTPAVVHFVSCEPLLSPIDLDPFCHAWEWAEDLGGLPGEYTLPGLDWVIVGGESGPHARPMRQSWAEDVISQCQCAGVAVFMKQTGTVLARQLGLRDPKGGDMTEWPAGLQVREWPRQEAQE